MNPTLLTASEYEVAEYLVYGLSQKEIAAELEKSEHTVRELNRRIHQKLAINKVSELCRWYYKIEFGVSLPAKKLRHVAYAFLSLFLLFFAEYNGVKDIRRAPSARTVRASGTARRNKNAYKLITA